MVEKYDRGWILEKFEEARPNARYTDFTLHNCFCIDGNAYYCHNFHPTDLAVYPGGTGAFTSGSWHSMEYKQVAIDGSSNAQFSITINNIEIFSKAGFQPND